MAVTGEGAEGSGAKHAAGGDGSGARSDADTGAGGKRKPVTGEGRTGDAEAADTLGVSSGGGKRSAQGAPATGGARRRSGLDGVAGSGSDGSRPFDVKTALRSSRRTIMVITDKFIGAITNGVVTGTGRAVLSWSAAS